MARGRANPTVSVDVDPDVTPAANPSETGGEGVASLFDFQGDARVRVLHRNEKTQRYEPHGYFPPEATEETILSEFGGGRFRVQLLVRDDTGREIIKTTRDIDLPGQYKVPTGDLPGIGTRAAGAPKVQNGNGAAVATIPTIPGSDDLMSVLKAGIINTLLDMMKTNKEVKSPAMDPAFVEIMKAQAASQQQMMTMMITMMTPLLTRGEGDSKKELLAMMTQMKEIIAPAAAAGDPMAMFNTMLETFTRMRDVAEDINPRPESGSGDPIMDSIPKLVEVVAEQHQMNKAARGQVTTTRTVPGPAGGTAQMPVVGTIGPNPPLAIWQQILRAHAARLLAAATAKQNPDVIAGMAILFAPPNVKEALALFFHREPVAVVADIQTEIPAMADHREWLDEFVEAAQEQLFPDEFADEDAADAGDAKDGDTSGR